MNKVPRLVFCYVGNKTYDFSSKKKDFLPKNDQIWSKIGILVNLGQAMQAYSVPCLWVGWWLWRAGCISQDTYLLYNISRPDYIFIPHDAHIEYLNFDNLKPRLNILPKAGKISSVRSEHAVAEVRLETVAAFCQFDGE